MANSAMGQVQYAVLELMDGVDKLAEGTLTSVRAPGQSKRECADSGSLRERSGITSA